MRRKLLLGLRVRKKKKKKNHTSFGTSLPKCDCIWRQSFASRSLATCRALCLLNVASSPMTFSGLRSPQFSEVISPTKIFLAFRSIFRQSYELYKCEQCKLIFFLPENSLITDCAFIIIIIIKVLVRGQDGSGFLFGISHFCFVG